MQAVVGWNSLHVDKLSLLFTSAMSLSTWQFPQLLFSGMPRLVVPARLDTYDTTRMTLPTTSTMLKAQ